MTLDTSGHHAPKLKPLKAPPPDKVFLRLYEAALTGLCSQLERPAGRSWCQEDSEVRETMKRAWSVAKRARELIDVEEASGE